MSRRRQRRTPGASALPLLEVFTLGPAAEGMTEIHVTDGDGISFGSKVVEASLAEYVVLTAWAAWHHQRAGYLPNWHRPACGS